MEKDWKEKYLNHLERVEGEIDQIKKDLMENPESLGNFEHRLYWAIRGVNPHKAVCTKHKQKITKNDWGEFICGDCVEDLIEKDIYNENLFFAPNDEPSTKINGIQYGFKQAYKF